MLIVVILAIISMSFAQDVVVKADDVQEITERTDNPTKVNPTHNPAPFGLQSKIQHQNHWYGNSHGQKNGGRH